MTEQKVDELVLALLEKTKAGKIVWEDVSDPDEDMFRAVVGDGLVRLARRRESWRDEEGIPRSMTYVTVWVFGSAGREVAHVEYSESTTFLSTANDLFELAKAQARNSDAEIDDMLQVLRTRA